MIKRTFDILVSVVGILIFSPVFIILGVVIFLEDGLPIFFKQERIGENLKPYSLIKFRSMRNEKITKVGAWVRNTGLDETLQFWIVLKGDMSVVGPRPLLKKDLIRLGWYELDHPRFQLKPGITGISQLYAGKSARISQYLDKWYVKNSSPILDCKIIALSFAVNVFGKKTVRSWLKT